MQLATPSNDGAEITDADAAVVQGAQDEIKPERHLIEHRDVQERRHLLVGMADRPGSVEMFVGEDPEFCRRRSRIDGQDLEVIGTHK
jgi:hypothetical protein